MPGIACIDKMLKKEDLLIDLHPYSSQAFLCHSNKGIYWIVSNKIGIKYSPVENNEEILSVSLVINNSCFDYDRVVLIPGESDNHLIQKQEGCFGDSKASIKIYVDIKDISFGMSSFCQATLGWSGTYCVFGMDNSWKCSFRRLACPISSWTLQY